MSGKFFNKPASELRILVAPLDWGIGHATRCIPIIYALQAAGAQVILAGDGNSEIILKKEFSSLPFLHLKGYNVRYSRQKRWFLLKLLSQFPRIKRTIQYEQHWLKKVVAEHKIDGIISDNRFGLSHNLIPSIYITHQLNIQTGNSLLTRLAQKIHYSYINRFTECWVPDAEGSINLGGLLSHPHKMPLVPVRYIGVLSRFSKTSCVKSNPFLVLLSGPEPQRSIFEEQVTRQLKKFSKTAILVRGLPSESAQLDTGPSVSVINYASGKELNDLILRSELVLCRAGYSTVMDLAVLQQKAILIPTPGQTEQEYLAASLHEKQQFFSCLQQNFNLESAFSGAGRFYNNAPVPVIRFEDDFIREWLQNVGRLQEVP